MQKKKIEENTDFYKNDIEAITKFISYLSLKNNVKIEDILEDVKKTSDPIKVPISIFKERKLGPLETITKFLKESYGLTYRQIAEKVDRNERSIWISYKKANKKQSKKLQTSKKTIKIPIHFFHHKRGILESLCLYLHDHSHLRFTDIAKLLNRNTKTIWTSYQKARSK